MSVELVVFDLAGTTVKDNKDVHRTLKNALSQHGVEISITDANAGWDYQNLRRFACCWIIDITVGDQLLKIGLQRFTTFLSGI